MSEPTEEQKELAHNAAINILHHIDVMYPGIKVSMSSSARTSIKNTIIKEVNIAMQAAGDVSLDILRSHYNGRCYACGWPLKESQEKGCIIGDCSYRPGENSPDYQGWRTRIEAERLLRQSLKDPTNQQEVSDKHLRISKDQFEKRPCTKCGTLCYKLCYIGSKLVCVDCFKVACDKRANTTR